MQQTQNYNLLIVEGTDVVNPLTQVNPNFQTIDGAMFANKQATIGTASEVVTGTVHAIIRNNPDSDVFRFTATGAWTAGDTMTLDGQQVTVHLSDGTTPATNSYIIGAEVLAMVNGSLVTLAISTTPPAQGVTSFNSRTGAVVPTASDYDASMVDYDNTGSGLNATDVQGAIDEIETQIQNLPTPTPQYTVLATSPASATTYGAKIAYLKTFYDALTEGEKMHCMVKRLTGVYNNSDVNGNFYKVIGGGSDFVLEAMRFADSTAYQLVCRTTGNTISNITNSTDGQDYSLILMS